MDEKHKNSIKKIIYVDTIDSTNKYANQLIADEVSENATVIWTNHQTNGRGQRNNDWNDEYGKSLLMSIILHQPTSVDNLFMLNKVVAISIVSVINEFLKDKLCTIKWPNDIIINDKKCGGVLIENQIKGAIINHSVIGIGINLYQELFATHLVNATSVLQATGITIQKENLLEAIVIKILENISDIDSMENNLLYQNLLWKKGEKIRLHFTDTNIVDIVNIEEIDPQGMLIFTLDGKREKRAYGNVKWLYDNQEIN